LNLIVDPEAAPRLRAFDTTRHGPNILRSRIQATAASGLEVFELDLLRDLIQRATGEPADVEQWGRRVGGSDALRLAADIPFDQIGEFCGAVDDVAASDAYRERFGWIDNIRPVTNADLIDKLEAQVLELLRARRTDLVQLAPPEVVDWDRLVRFQYHFDTGSRPLLSRQDISSDSYLGGLKAEDLNSVTARQLRGRKIVGLDANDDRIEEWPVWRCLVAEFTMADRTYILEDGAFYEVASSYLDQLNEDIGVFDRQQPILPPSRTTLTEPDYNQLAADSSSDLVLMDTQMVPFEGAPNGVELCDILTADKQLIHVKRYGGSSTLSHLYLQARTASELLITSTDFRRDAQVEINGAANDGRFNFFEEDRIEPRQFEIVLGIIKQWRAKGIESLPFFAKINLRHTLVDLSSLGYAVSVLRIPFEPAGEDAPGGEERQP
jgi:uncharacterized protein (TIGR04141 family)